MSKCSFGKPWFRPGYFPRFDGEVFPGPTLFVGGWKSEYLSRSHHDDIRELFPKARFEYVPGAGHWVHAEKPKEFMAVLDDHL